MYDIHGLYIICICMPGEWIYAGHTTQPPEPAFAAGFLRNRSTYLLFAYAIQHRCAAISLDTLYALCMTKRSVWQASFVCNYNISLNIPGLAVARKTRKKYLAQRFFIIGASVHNMFAALNILFISITQRIRMLQCDPRNCVVPRNISWYLYRKLKQLLL